MARIHPSGWQELGAGAAAGREIETLRWLDGALGEDGLVRRYPGRSVKLAAGLARDLRLLGRRLDEVCAPEPCLIDALIYCPDYRVRDPGCAGIAAERIVDADARARLAEVIRGALPAGEPGPMAARVERFFADLLRLVPDVSALVGQVRTLLTRVSGGLAYWAREIELAPHRLRVSGSAGSGKTQLALAEYAAALAAGGRPLYVCFNRPLADHFAHIAPAGGLACSFHQLCDLRLRAAGRAPDFSTADAYRRLVDEARGVKPGETLRFDCVIVDEGQDFSADWRDLVLSHANPGARLLWLEDPLQNLYGQAPVPLDGWVGLRARRNYRSPV